MLNGLNFRALVLLIFVGTFYVQNIDAYSQKPLASKEEDPLPQPIPNYIFLQLNKYAHLIDIAYCVSSTNQISNPFQCDLNCNEAFPDMKLLHQWHLDDSVAGYLAIGNNIFGDRNNSPKLILSLRGTRSISDTFTDLKLDVTNYYNPNINLAKCGSNCKIHKGFYENYLETIKYVEALVISQFNFYKDINDDLEFHIMGHSLGGAVALLLSLYFKDLGYENKLVTMGQPLIGNRFFTNWADEVFKSSNTIETRTYLRVIHKMDFVPTIPSKDLHIQLKMIPPFLGPTPHPSFGLNDYVQFNNQIYINSTIHNYTPTNTEVVDCFSGTNRYCIRSDFSFPQTPGDHPIDYDAHLNYFRHIGLCGVRI